MSEKRTIKGEIEGWAQEVREFGKSNRGCRGLKVEGNWSNLIGEVEDLEKLDTQFPMGTFVEFVEKKNKKGYWDVSGSIKQIDKKAAYAKEPADTPKEKKGYKEEYLVEIGSQPKAKPKDVDKEIRLQVAFKGAIHLISTEIELVAKDSKLVDVDETCKRILAATEILYKGISEKRIQLQEAGEW